MMIGDCRQKFYILRTKKTSENVITKFDSQSKTSFVKCVFVCIMIEKNNLLQCILRVY